MISIPRLITAGLLLACATAHAERIVRDITFARAGRMEPKPDLYVSGANLARIDAFLRRNFTNHE